MERGEIWQLGHHRLMCDDATSHEDISRLMGEDRAKILFTSPPYSDLRNYKGHDLRPEYLAEFIPNAKRYCDVQCLILGMKRSKHEIIQYWDVYISRAKSCGLKLLAWNVWDKGSPGSIAQQQAMFPLRHEFIFVFGEKAYKLNRTIPKHGRPDYRQFNGIREPDGTISHRNMHRNPDEPMKPLESVVKCFAEKGSAHFLHPAVMPLKLPVEYVKAMTHEGDIVLDPFGGSGTMMIACEGTGRTCYMMEISREYCDVIIARWEKLTPMYMAERID